MTAITPEAKPTIRLGVPIRRFRDRLLLGLPDGAIELDAVSMRIATLLDGDRTVEQVAELIGTEFGVPSDAVLDDVLELLADLDRREVLDW